MLCAIFGWNWPSGSWEIFFKICSISFYYFAIISPWRRAWLFIWTNLNPLHPRMLCAKFGWNWLSGSEEEVENRKCLQKDRQMMDDRRSEKLTWAKKPHIRAKLCFVVRLRQNKDHNAHLRKLFKSIYTYDMKKPPNYLLYENWMVLNLNKFESPSPKDALCQVWLKLAQWFWRRIFC